MKLRKVLSIFSIVIISLFGLAPLEMTPHCSAAGLGSRIIAAGSDAPLGAESQRKEFLTGPWHDARNYGSLSAAVAAIGSAEATLSIPKSLSVTSNITIPANVTLSFLQGGKLAIAKGVTVTMNGHIEAGRYKIFDLTATGAVSFGPGSVGEAPVEWWGASGDDRTDNVAALTAAIASVNESYGNPTIILGPGHYRIGSVVVINKNNLTMRGVGHRISKLRCTAPGAGLVLDKGGKKVLYTTRLEEFDVDGNSVASVGIDLINTSETTFRHVSVRGCTTGIRIGGAVSPSQCVFTECVVADCTTGVKFAHATNPIFDKGNFWNNTTVFDFDVAYSPVFTSNWIEKFTTCFLFSHSSSKGKGVAVHTLMIRNNYFLSMEGGRTYDCRIFKFPGDNGSYTSNAGPIVFEGNHLYLYGAKYIAEIAWGDLLSNGNRVQLVMKENHLHGGQNTAAWFKTDVTTDSLRPHAHVIFQHNEYPPGVVVQDGSGGFVTGVGAMGLDFGTANRVLGAFVYAPVITFAANHATPSVKLGNVFKTANTSPTTISMFADGIAGQKIMVIIGDSNTTVAFKGTNLKGNAGKDWKPSDGDWMECLSDGIRWYCSVHSTTP